MGAPLIGVVDDDESMRHAISSLIRSAGFRAVLFPSAEVLLNSDQLQDTECLILDRQMPGLSGLDLQHRLAVIKGSIPIIFVTALLNDEVRTQALKRGAVALLPKPFSDKALLDAMGSALR